MIDFRYHLVSTIAVFLALAAGIVLGTTTLQDPLLDRLNTDAAQLRTHADELRGERDAADRRYAASSALIEAHADELLEGRLDGARVAVFEAPGADSAAAEEISSLVAAAGGEVTARLAFTERYLDPGEAAFIRELTDQLAEGEGLPDAGVYPRVAALLAATVFTDSGGGEPDADAAAVLAGFAEAELLDVDGAPGGGADLAIVLAPEQPFAADNDGDGGNAAFLDLARAAGAAGAGAVIAGNPNSAGASGLLGHARSAAEEFSTVDVAGDTSGNVVTVLALASTADGTTGDYGVGAGADGFLPEPLPEPRAADTGDSDDSDDSDDEDDD